MSEVKEFKTESKRLLDLMINSIYTNKEIFLRELISNASDAIDKYHYHSLIDENLEKRTNYEIFLEIDKANRQLKIIDNGIGMTYDEVVNNLGTIARSGSLEFMKNLSQEQFRSEIDIIGQFGVGFYSAFMVAQKVVVETKSPFSEKGYRFTSSGTDSYEIEEIEKTSIGTSISLFLRENQEEENYDEFLEEYKIKSLVKKYSDYVRYPIQMNIVEEEPKLDADGKEIEGEYETKITLETLNSMVPLWKKRKSEVSDEELNAFYKQKFNDYQDPQLSLFLNIEGNITYNALIFIPKKAPHNLYSEKYEKGLQLYTKGVFIMDKCKELIPDYLRFAKGLVDSSDLSLNISREILQQNRQLTKIAQNVEKKILSRLEKLMADNYDEYLEFYKNFGLHLKYGIYENFGEKKDLLKDLLIYTSVNNEKMISLKDYVEKMKEGQEFIYYASSKSKEAVKAMPQMDLIKKQEYDVLVLTDDVDEFAINILNEFNGKKFKSINQGDLDLLSNEEKEAIKELNEEHKTLLEKLKEVLKDEVSDIKLSKRLTDSPVCLISGDGVSFEMEKVMANIPNSQEIKANRILEINPHHNLFKAIDKIYQNNDEAFNTYASLLYSQALLIEGFSLKDPVDFSNKMCELMIKSAK